MRAELKRLQRDLGRTLVCVTHDQVEAMSMPDRVAVLREGVVQQVDSPENVYHRPVNRFVATVVGSPPMNFIPCTVGARNGGLQLKHDYSRSRFRRADWRWARAWPRAETACSASAPRMSASTAGAEAFGATVYTSEPLGGETVVDLQVAPRSSRRSRRRRSDSRRTRR